MLFTRNMLPKASQYALYQGSRLLESLLCNLLGIVKPSDGSLDRLAVIDRTVVLGPKLFDLLISQIVNVGSTKTCHRSILILEERLRNVAVDMGYEVFSDHL